VTSARSPRSKAKPDAIARGDILAGKSRRRLPIYARDTINAGARLAGPMVVVELSATTYVAPEFALRSDDYGNLHLEAR
jgi:N-methylhydantoinase A/oxoprolinase/acetone carboxylase beta subunit